MVNKLAPVYCEEVSLEGALTKNITLYEMMNILNVGDIVKCYVDAIDIEKGKVNLSLIKE